jgi:hypothetical protein
MGKVKIEIKWALIFSVVTILWMGFERLMGWHGANIEQHATMTNLFAIVAILLYALALLDKRNNYYHGIMSWKQGFISGCILSVFIALLAPVALYISITLVSPEYFPNIIAYSVDTGVQTQAEAEANFNLSNYTLQSSIFALIVGIVTSAVVAIFVKRSPSGNISGAA